MNHNEKSSQLAEVQLISSQKQSQNLEPASKQASASTIPNGGLTAWLQCAGSFFIFFSCWGIINTYGVFQTFYEQNLLADHSSSDISWIGSIQASLLMFLGVLTGPLFDRGYLRTLLLIGTFLTIFGMMMTSLCKEYWQVILAQGIIVGLGCGFIFVPSVAILPTYFSTRRSLALGIGASGSSFGGIIYPIIFHKLEPQIGFPWTTRVMAFIMFATLLFPLIFMKTRLKPSSGRRIIDLAAWKEIPYLLFGIGLFLTFVGLYVPFFYVQIYAISEGIVDQNLGFYLLALLNSGSFFGRIINNYIADKTDPLNVSIPCGVATAILAFGWIGIKSVGGIIIFCLLYGFFSGPLVSLPPSVVATLSPHPGVIGTRMGMIFVPIACGLLVGNPIAGAILNGASGNNWVGLEIFCAVSVLLSAGFYGAARMAKVGWKMGARA